MKKILFKNVGVVARVGFLLAVQCCSAAVFAQVKEVPVSNYPLEGGTPPLANVLLLMDDSASMDWEVVARGNVNSLMQVEFGASTDIRERYFLYGNLYADSSGKYLNYHAFDSRDGHAIPTFKAVQTFLGNYQTANGVAYPFAAQLEGMWRARNSDFNPIYYDPNKRYYPWPGDPFDAVDNNGDLVFTTFGNAIINPNATDVLDLSANNPTQYLFRNPLRTATQDAHGEPLNINAVVYDNANPTTYVTGTDAEVYIPMYYTYDDANGNGLVEPGECHRLVEIKANYNERLCDGSLAPIANNAPYLREQGPDRTDCTRIPGSENHQCNFIQEQKNFVLWFTFYRKKEFAAKAAFATVAGSNDVNDVNLGFSTVNVMDPDRNTYTDISGNTVTHGAKALVGEAKEVVRQAIYETTSGPGGTQLLRALEGAGQYFKCTTTEHDVFDNAADTSGTPACPRLDSNSGGACQTNMTVLMSDGFWEINSGTSSDGEYNGGYPASYGDWDVTANNYFTGGAFAHTQDASNTNMAPATLADVAMYWYMNDLDGASGDVMPMFENLDIPRINNSNGLLWNGTPFMHQHMKTFTIGFAVFNDGVTDAALSAVDAKGNWAPPSDPSTAINWPTVERSATDSNKLEDIKHAAYNGRGHFYAANNADQLVDGLKDAVTSTLMATGANSAVSFNTEDDTSGGLVFAASYNTDTNSGDVMAYAINAGVPTTEVWSANEELNKKVTRAADCSDVTNTRKVVTYNAATHAGVEFTGLQGKNLNANEVDCLRGLNVQEESCSTSGPYRNRSVLDINTGLPIANTTSDAQLIGDVVNSRPLYVGAPVFSGRVGGNFPTSATYEDYKTAKASRTPLVLVGTNGGFLHAFNGTDGSEVFAYIPGALMDESDDVNQAEELLNTDYSHKWYLDLSPTVNDVFIAPRGSLTRAWRTVAIGGYRGGGKGYFALDITDDITSVAQAQASIMWEFGVDSLAPGDKGKLGLSYSTPLMAMINEAHTNTTEGYKWKAIFGNGYNSEDGRVGLFVVDLEGGYNGWSATEYDIISPTGLDAGPQANGFANGLSTPRAIDTNGDGSVDFAYAGDLAGNVWRFDLRDDTAASASGISDSSRATLIFRATDGSSNKQAITTQPMIVSHPHEAGKYIVVVTTGSWLTRNDARNEASETHSIYGITDEPTATVTTVPVRADLEQRTITDSGGYRTITDVDTTDQNLVEHGWYMDLAPGGISSGERAIRNMTYRGGYVFIASVIPGGVSCDSSMGGALMGLNPQTGLLEVNMFDFNGDGDFNDANEDSAGKVSVGSSLSDLAMLGSQLIAQRTDASGQVTQENIDTNTDQPGRQGRLSWRQLQ